MMLPLFIADAHAGGAAPDAESMALVLAVLGLVAAAYLLTHFVVSKLQDRFLLVTGVEYVALGAVLGHTLEPLAAGPKLHPIVAFTVGWVGLLRGIQLTGRFFRRVRGTSIRLAVLDVLVVGGLVAAFTYGLLQFGMAVAPRTALEVAAGAGCAAAAGSVAASQLLARRFGSVTRGLLPTVEISARLTEVLAILGLGVLMSASHTLFDGAEVVLGPSDWLLVTLGLGLGLGWLFAIFLGDDHSDNSRFLAMVGIISLATGAAMFLDVAVLAVNLVLGAVLANSARGAGLAEVLEPSRKPMVLVMLVLAGVLWRPVPLGDGLLVCAGFIGLRLVGKLVAGLLASAGTPLRGDIGRGTFAQGEVALAIALSLRLLWEDSVYVDLVFTGIVASVLCFELVAPRLLKGVLVDSGELRQDFTLPAPVQAEEIR